MTSHEHGKTADERKRHCRPGQLLASFRERVGVTQQALAIELNISVPLVSSWETDRRQIHGGKLGDIADVLDLTPKDANRLTWSRLPALDPSWLARQPPNQQAGLLLAALRERAGLTQKALADAMGIHHRTVIHWEMGTTHAKRVNTSSLGEYYLTLSEAMPARRRWFGQGDVDRLQTICALSNALSFRPTGYRARYVKQTATSGRQGTTV